MTPNDKLPANSTWQLKEHDNVERPYWEITNGAISLCVDDEDIVEEHITAMKEIVSALNSGGIKFRSENALEIKQHIEIMQLQEELKNAKDAAVMFCNKFNVSQTMVAEVVDLLSEIADTSCDYESVNFDKPVHSPDCRACKARKFMKQFKDGKGKEVELSCMVCGTKFMGPEPKMCCSGRDCGCMGLSIDPIVCSKECYEKGIPPQKGDSGIAIN